MNNYEKTQEALKMLPYNRNPIASSLDTLGQIFHENAVLHGFWPLSGEGAKECNDVSHVIRLAHIDVSKRNKGEMIALMHSELSEMLEGVRKPSQDQHCSEFTSEEVEAADTVIRLLEYCAAYKLRLGEAVIAKHNYNVGREFKHGKKF